jgi:hypothetical protein
LNLKKKGQTPFSPFSLREKGIDPNKLNVRTWQTRASASFREMGPWNHASLDSCSFCEEEPFVVTVDVNGSTNIELKRNFKIKQSGT